MTLLECKNLCIGYNSKSIQSNLNFKIDKGDYVYIIGENGTGKSTLLKTILGFIKPMSGNIIFSNEWNLNEIGYIPQTNDIQKTFPATVWEIVLSGCQSQLGFSPFYKKKHKELARKNLQLLEMENYKNKSFKELSGGQQQRILFARALCAAKSVLIMDEPSKGFDTATTLKMYEIIEQLNKDGMTIITISHDLEAVKKYNSKILKLKKTGDSNE